MSPSGHSQALLKQNRSCLIPALIPNAACPADGRVREQPQLLLHKAPTLHKQQRDKRRPLQEAHAWERGDTLRKRRA